MGHPVASGVKVVPMGVAHDIAYSATRDWCSWDRMYGREYLVPYYVVFSQEKVAEIARITERAYGIFQKALRFVQAKVPDEYLVHQLGVPHPLIDAARSCVPYTGITRFDLALVDNNMYILEYNADTPTGVVETAYVACDVIRRFSHYQNPSAQMNRLIHESLAQLISYYRAAGHNGSIVFSAAGRNEEDKGTVLYTRQQLQLQTEYADLEDLRVDRDGLYAQDKKVDIWYRLYPWEHLPHDIDESGFPTGEYLLEFIANGQLRTISAPQEIIMQSKGLQAFIWELAELKSPLFTVEDREFIQRYFLPSAFAADYFLNKQMAYVSKPFFGREGGAVTLFDGSGNVEERDGEAHYWEQPMLFQKRVELPNVQIETEEGRIDGYLLVGSFCVGGKYAGVLPRIGGKITGNLSCFAPAAME